MMMIALSYVSALPMSGTRTLVRTEDVRNSDTKKFLEESLPLERTQASLYLRSPPHMTSVGRLENGNLQLLLMQTDES